MHAIGISLVLLQVSLVNACIFLAMVRLFHAFTYFKTQYIESCSFWEDAYFLLAWLHTCGFLFWGSQYTISFWLFSLSISEPDYYFAAFKLEVPLFNLTEGTNFNAVLYHHTS